MQFTIKITEEKPAFNQLSKDMSGYLLSYYCSMIWGYSREWGELSCDRLHPPSSATLTRATPMKPISVSELFSSPPGNLQVVFQSLSTPSSMESLSSEAAVSAPFRSLYFSYVLTIGIGCSALDFINSMHQFLLLLSSATSDTVLSCLSLYPSMWF